MDLFFFHQESQARHFMKFIASEKSKNAAYKVGLRLDDVTQQVHEQLRKNLDDNPGALEIAK